MTLTLTPADPFDLPEWLGTQEVVWSSETGLGSVHLVPGHLHSQGHELACDLLAVDESYPAPVVAETIRTQSHREWHNAQVLVLDHDGRLTLAVPGTRFDPVLAMSALGRLALAVGADPARYSVQLRISRDSKRHGR